MSAEVTINPLDLLGDATLPLAFRLLIGARMERGLNCRGLNLTLLVAGWNAAAAETDRVTLPVLRSERPVVAFTTFREVAGGYEVAHDAEVLHPQWRQTVEAGEQLPQEEDRLFTTETVSKTFIPRETWVAKFGGFEELKKACAMQPLKHEGDVIPVEGGAHDVTQTSTPERAASNPFPGTEGRQP